MSYANAKLSLQKRRMGWFVAVEEAAESATKQEPASGGGGPYTLMSTSDARMLFSVRGTERLSVFQRVPEFGP